MAIKTFYATRDLKNPSYGNRMLKAGDPVELDAPKARLYLALGAVSPTKPRKASPDANTLSVNGDLVATVTAPPKAPAKRKAAPRKKAAKKAK